MSKKWKEVFEELKLFVENNNGFPAVKDNKEFYNWIRKNIRYYKNGKLKQNRIDMLESLPNWGWEGRMKSSILEKRWEIKFQELKDFVIKNKKYPSQRSKNNEEKQLSIWIMSNRKFKNTMKEERKNKLESLPKWKWIVCVKPSWEDSFNKLVNFIKENEKLPSSSSLNCIEKTLGLWFYTQKRNYKKNNLSQERVNKLESIVELKLEKIEFV